MKKFLKFFWGEYLLSFLQTFATGPCLKPWTMLIIAWFLTFSVNTNLTHKPLNSSPLFPQVSVQNFVRSQLPSNVWRGIQSVYLLSVQILSSSWSFLLRLLQKMAKTAGKNNWCWHELILLVINSLIHHNVHLFAAMYLKVFKESAPIIIRWLIREGVTGDGRKNVSWGSYLVVGSDTDVFSREELKQGRLSFKSNDKKGCCGTGQSILAKNRLMYL
jgi:hypothetical protein